MYFLFRNMYSPKNCIWHFKTVCISSIDNNKTVVGLVSNF